MTLRNRMSFTEENCFFVTTTCYKFLRLIELAEAKGIVVESLNFVAKKYNAFIFSFVIMPNHIHLILYFPEKNRLSDLMRDFKKFTAVKLRHLIEGNAELRLLENLRYELRDQKFKIWMDRFDDVCLTSTNIFHTKLDYIHNNPLQEHWKLAAIPEDYIYSSAGYYYGKYSCGINVTNYIDYIW